MRRRTLLIGLAGGLVAMGMLTWLAMGPSPHGAVVLSGDAAPPPALEPGDSIRVLTWNLHYGAGPTLERGRSGTRDEVVARLDAIARAVRDWDADVVAFQEVDRAAARSFDIDQLEWLREATGLSHAAWTTTWQVGWVPYPGLKPSRHIGRVKSGQVVLSRYPIRSAHRHALPQPKANHVLYNRFYLHRALLDAELDLGGGAGMRVVNAHLEAFDVANKQRQAELVAEALADCGPGVVFLGDMNAVPPEAKVRHGFPDEPETDLRQDDTIARLRAIPGITDALPPAAYAAGEHAWFTFPAHAPNRRLDYVFAGSLWQRTTITVPRPEPPLSDHLPVLVELRLGEGSSASSTPSDTPR